MSRTLRLSLFIAVPLLVILLPVAAFAVDRAIGAGEVARNVTVEDVALGGLGRDDAEAAVVSLGSRLASTPALFEVSGMQFALEPARAGFALDAPAVVDAAMEVGRTGNLFTQFGDWLGGLTGDRTVEPVTSLDEDDLEDVLVAWEEQAIPDRAHQGGVDIVDGRPVADYPSPGRTIDRDAAAGIVLRVASRVDRLPAELPTTTELPDLTRADVDAAVAEASLLLDGPVTLTADDPVVSITFSVAELVTAFESRLVRNSPTRIELGFSVDRVAALLEPYRDQIEHPPSDATWVVNPDDTITIVPSRPGTVMRPGLVAEHLLTVAVGDDVGEFPFGEGVEPDFTTEEAAGVGPITLVSKFTTEYPAGQPRVINIHTMADTVNGAIVWPGRVFSLNEYVGPRTEEKGYVPAPMILRGEFVDDVGGGVSQFATTFYNAVFFGCYEDVEHQPHSYYFTRYPEGREATISWPRPDLKFRNNTDTPVLIKTQYTSTSITVKFFGNNGGKTCESRLSERYSPTTPDTLYVPDPSMAPTEERTLSGGSDGWSVTIYRTITNADGTSSEQSWVHTYQPQPREVRTHPCNIPAGFEGHTGEPCPAAIPALGGLLPEEARARVVAAGFVYAVGEPIQVTAESGLAGRVAEHTSGYLQPGGTVTVRLGVAPPPPEPPPSDG
jgi:vancomycin resistance protein YoaR